MQFKKDFLKITEDFVYQYNFYFDRKLSLSEIPSLINRGDCGTYAAIIFFILGQKYPTMTINENENHAFIGFNNLYFDSFFSEGISIEDMNRAYSTDRSKVVSLSELFQSFSYIDPVGCRLVRGFCARWGVSIDPLYEEVIANELEYDSEDWLVQFRTREETIKAVRKTL